MLLTRHELDGHAAFHDEGAFLLSSCPFPGDIPLGRYELPRRSGDAHLYRLTHPLAEAVLTQAKQRALPPAEIHFDYRGHGGKITLLEPLAGQSGWLALSRCTLESLNQAEDHLIFAAVTDDGQLLDEETARRLFTLPGRTATPLPVGAGPGVWAGRLDERTQRCQAAIQEERAQRNAQCFEAEAEKLDGWADDLKLGLEREIKDIDREIREARRVATRALTLEDKLAGQKQIKTLEAQRNQKRRSLFDAQDRVDQQREALIAQIEGKLAQTMTVDPLFALRWTLS